tara:strand:+ start:152 stop:505 length:354 start_codon:yes stop_codon:yes gene_type:complete
MSYKTFIPLTKRWPKKLTKELVSHLTHLLPPDPTQQQLASWIALHGVLDTENPEPVLTVTLPSLKEGDANIDIFLNELSETTSTLAMTTINTDVQVIPKDTALRLYKLLAFYLAKQS